MRNIILLFILFLFVNILCAADSAQNIYRITYVMRSNEWYQRQSELWEKIVSQNKSEENAWRNYYLAERYAGYLTDDSAGQKKKARLNKIIAEMRKFIGDTYTFYYLNALNAPGCDQIDINSLEYAHQKWPSQPEILYELITYYEIKGHMEKVRDYCRKLYRSEDIARGLLEYNANMLLSARPNSILFTNGDNDTYPAMILQNVKDFCNRVLVVNVHMAFSYRNYLNRILRELNVSLPVDQFSKTDMNQFFQELVHALMTNYSQTPVYMACTLNRSLTDGLKEDLYLVGLIHEYSKERIENLTILKENVLKNMRLDYLFDDWYGEKYPARDLITALNQNYIVAFMNLAEYFAGTREITEAQYLQQMALNLAKQGDNHKMIDKIEAKKLTAE